MVEIKFLSFQNMFISKYFPFHIFTYYNTMHVSQSILKYVNF